MRKKSAFLERLTARAAAAFEAGSFGASDEQEPNNFAAQDMPELKSPLPSQYLKPSDSPETDDTLVLQEQSTIVYTTSKSVTNDDLAKPIMSLVTSPAEAVASPIPAVVSTVTPTVITNEASAPTPIPTPAPAAKPSPEPELALQACITTDIPEPQKSPKTLPPAKAPEDDEERICASLGLVAKLLFAHMIGMEKKVLNMKKICLYNQNNEPISYPSIRTAWGRLKDLGIVAKSARHDVGKEKGVLFQLDGRYTFAFQKLYPQMLGQTEPTASAFHAPFQHTIQQSLLHVPQAQQFGLQSSIQPLQPEAQVSLDNAVPSKPKTKLEVHPEYYFWREYGLTQTQCSRWKEEFGLDELLLDNFLRWCAHDLGQGDRKDKSGKHISNPANWFYSLLKKTGAYPKPEGYQSHEEKTVLMRESALKEQAALQARQEALRVEEEKNEAEALFATFLEEGEQSPHFSELCQKVSPFLYENRHARRRLFESALRTEYFKFLGISNF